MLGRIISLFKNTSTYFTIVFRMPPKRKMKKQTCVKQKREIQSKLMLISFQVDDYIYKKVPIAIIDAQNFQQEIHSYKDICRDDVRSMQVIDKLSRLLQKIIEEQTRVIEESHSKHICNTSVSESVTLLTSKSNIQCEDFEKAAKESEDQNSINKDARIDSEEHNDTPEINFTDKICNSTQEFSNTTGDKFEDIEIGIQEPRCKEDMRNVINNASLTNSDVEQTICSKANGIMAVTDRENIYPSHENIKKKHIKKSEEKVALKESNDVTQNTCLGDKHDSNRNMQTFNATRNKRNISRKPNSVIDLSWVENIKYVREIDPEEFDPKLKDVSETFWQNCIFPRDWDDNDFLTD